MYIIIIRNSYNIVNILRHFIDNLFYVYDTIVENILLSKNNCFIYSLQTWNYYLIIILLTESWVKINFPITSARKINARHVVIH